MSLRCGFTGMLLMLMLSFTQAQADDCAALFELMDQRLELMDEVAADKWRHGRSIEDAEREAEVILAAVQEGLRFGLDPAASRRFMQAQIEAAKDIQHYWFRIWETGPYPGQVPDLEKALRPELNRLGGRIAETAGRVGEPGGCDASLAASTEVFQTTVSVTGLSASAQASLLTAVQSLERFANRLEQILATGELRIGTTGDYAPFSHRARPTDEFTGIDIDLGRHLAASLGVRAVFVETSWPGLLDDLAAGLYDIAMSGVSRNLERQKRGYLSPPYHAGGKTPIARCVDAARFGSLAEIDRAGVRVIVNPGGTNEQFVDAQLQRATKVVHADNRTIFDALQRGEADIMITDRVEVVLQSTRRPDLCSTMAVNLTYQEKAYLLPRDEPWREFVATWLELALADGTVAEVFRAHGAEPGTNRRLLGLSQ